MPWWTLGLKKAESSFWIVWIVFSVLAAVGAAGVTLLADFRWGMGYFTAVPERVLYNSVLGAVIGAIIGTGQWLVLRKVVQQASWWVLASALAAVAVVAVGEAVVPTSEVKVPYFAHLPVDIVGALAASEAVLSSFVLGAVTGAITGTAQWLFLRRRVQQAGLWVLASVVGWALAKTVHVLLYSAITGLVLVLLLRWRIQPGDPAPDP